ncbi:MAG: glycosyltransferase family 4 protein [Planctomycetota bacterium]
MSTDVAALADVRILHLFANFKWTGPADPAIRTAVHLRRLGLDVVFARATWTLPGAEHRMEKELAKACLPLIGGLDLPKHFRALSLLRDRRTLSTRLRHDEFGLVHAHQPTDHLVATLAKHRAGKAGHRVRVVRTLYDPEAPPPRFRARMSFGSTDGVVVPSEAVAEAVRARFGFPSERILVQEPTTERRPGSGDLRVRWSLEPEHVVVGITARIQPHRRFDLLWEVAATVVREAPHVRFVLLGRGNDEDTERLVRAPVAQRGLEKYVVLPGYLHEPDYSAALRSLDAFLFLVPGSDGTCRAVREAMAVGLPVVATARGMLPQILAPDAAADAADAVPGFAVSESAEALAASVLRLVRDPALRRAMGAAARAKVERAMEPVRAARRLAAFYRTLVER